MSLGKLQVGGEATAEQRYFDIAIVIRD